MIYNFKYGDIVIVITGVYSGNIGGVLLIENSLTKNLAVRISPLLSVVVYPRDIIIL